MAFQISPGINVSEIDLTTIVPAVASTDGAIAGVFRWGPLEQRTLIDSENALALRFGKPTNLNAETWFVASSFLSYGNRLHVARAANTSGLSPNLASASVISGNANVVVTSTSNMQDNTTYYVLSVANSTGGLTNAIKIGSSVAKVNSTAIALSTNSDALATLAGAQIQLVTNTAFNAVANVGFIQNLTAQNIKNEEHFNSKSDFDANTIFAARYPGELGNSIKVSICANTSGYKKTIGLSAFGNTSTKASFVQGSRTANVTVYDTDLTTVTISAQELQSDLNVTDRVEVGNTYLGFQYLKITNVSAPNTSGSNTVYGQAVITLTFDESVKLASNVEYVGSSTTANSFSRYWEYFNVVDQAPALSDYMINFGNNSVTSDELHIVVTDEGGKFTGVPGTILEVYKNVSRASDSKTIDGSTNYYKNIINDASKYIYSVGVLPGANDNTAENLTDSTLDVNSWRFNLGKDGKDESDIELSVHTNAYALFAKDIDISLVMTGKTREGINGFYLANWITDNLVEIRKDCISFISPPKSAVVNNSGREADLIVALRNNLRSTSYSVLDSGYKYMYDKYNDLYRWIPLNGDIAGLCVRTDSTNDPWWSPAGLNRGQIKNVVRLAYNPSQADRDILYKNGINPVVTFPGQGTILYGDKTLLSRPSAFDRINVRRLFIVLEKAIATASKYTLFEFNDEFTRNQFKNLVVPYLRDIQGRRGITDFIVVCDESNNTPEVRDRNEFIGDIYIKPARSINYIQLNFVAVKSGISFSEIINQAF
jgi:hypothetical protein